MGGLLRCSTLPLIRNNEKNKQVTNTVMMIRPACFGYNSETALDNVYQKKNSKISSSEIAEKALLEFDNFVDILENAGINVIQFEDDLKSITPDAIFLIIGSVPIKMVQFVCSRCMQRTEELREG